MGKTAIELMVELFTIRDVREKKAKRAGRMSRHWGRASDQAVRCRPQGRATTN